MNQEFPNSPRFEARRRLGAGSFGVVYEAYDRERQLPVAVKVLRSGESDALFLFKREFRALADLNHHNLVTLYELLADGSRWFFTMELLEGRPFTNHVWDVPSGFAGTPTPLTSSETVGTTVDLPRVGLTPLELTATVRPIPVVRLSVDYDGLRETLRQLARGLVALHEAGKLHRDIKPGNVLVTFEGRVVLLDFGLVADLAAADAHTTLGPRVVGTPAYMSPEQAAGDHVSAASDWYGVGVMLYEVLTSRLPFAGSVSEIRDAKQREDVPLVRSEFPDVPADLSDLCRDLLARDPARRPSGRDVLARLNDASGATTRRSRTARDTGLSSSFVGRARELAMLADAFAAMTHGRAVTAYVHAISGMGKTTVVRHFLQQLRQHEREAVVLTGRCYQQESVPYKAFDLLIDELSQWFRTLPAGTVEALLPRDVLALVRLFPVLNRVKEVSQLRRRTPDIPDAQELRRRAVAAFRELLARVAERWPLVLFIDDLQWSDLDSTHLIGEVLRPPDPPRLLFVGAYRSDEAETSPALRALLTLHRTDLITVDTREIPLQELGSSDVAALVTALTGSTELEANLTDLVYRESGGNPFFVSELARLALSRKGVMTAGEVTLESAIATRIAAVAEPAARLLKVLTLAGRPISPRVALQAADLAPSDYGILTSLRVAQLVRARETDRAEEIELYHDRIRDVVSRQIQVDEAVALHRRLASALEEAGGADPETLALHFSMAGSTDRAAEHAIVAADRASAAFAFDRAARLYELALQLRPGDDAVPTLRLKLADALANAGRGGAAGRAYLSAAEGMDHVKFVELQRRAAEQFLISGHMDQGLIALGNVLDALGMRLARTPQQAMLRLLVRRMLIRMRGLQFRERDVTALRQNDLLQIDSCWSVAVGLAFVDNIRAADFQARHCLLALRSGEPYRVARALALEAGYSATGGTRTQRRTQAVTRAALSLAERVQNPHAIGLASLTAGIAAHLEGRWKASFELCERAEAILSESCTGVTWELDTANLHILFNLLSLGELTELCDRLPALANDARARGDLYGSTALQLRVGFVAALVRDDPVGAMEGINTAESAWPRRQFLLQHYWSLVARLDILAYEGNGSAAYDLINPEWKQLASAQLLRVQFSTVESHYRRGRSALMWALDLPSASERRAALLQQVRRDGRTLKRQRAEWSVGLGYLLHAGAAHADRRADDERLCLLRAEECFANAGMASHAVACRGARGRLLGGDQGRALVAESEQWHRARHVVNPTAFARMTVGWSD